MQFIEILMIPTLLITGDVGSIISPELASELAQLNSCVTSVQMTEAGHGIPFDQPERLAAIVKNFLCS